MRALYLPIPVVALLVAACGEAPATPGDFASEMTVEIDALQDALVQHRASVAAQTTLEGVDAEEARFHDVAAHHMAELHHQAMDIEDGCEDGMGHPYDAHALHADLDALDDFFAAHQERMEACLTLDEAKVVEDTDEQTFGERYAYCSGRLQELEGGVEGSGYTCWDAHMGGMRMHGGTSSR